MDTSIYWLLLSALCVWRLTRLLTFENGPGDVFARLRGAVGQGFGGTLLGCFACCSMWVAIPFALVIGDGWLERALLWPALSGIAILLQRLEGLVEPNQNSIKRSQRKSCCGEGKDKATKAASRTTLSEPRVAPWIFQYVGQESRTVMGKSTGRKYRWVAYGAQVEVDERDAPHLMTFSDLKVRGSRGQQQ